jgi:hypothetical protein
MNTIQTNLAADINRLHNLASLSADEAVAHAKQAGMLLLEAKASMKHGDWLPWLEANITVSPRQVQRYLHVAQGRPLPIRMEAAHKPAPIKNDTVSHLEVTAPGSFSGEPDAPQFVPDASLCHAHATADAMFLVEPSQRHSGFFFVSRLDADDEHYDCTRRPVGAEWVEMNLQHFGLAEPSAVAWRVRPSTGVLAAMETFEGVAA